MKKLQDNVQYLQLRLAAKEHTCKNLQEKVNLKFFIIVVPFYIIAQFAYMIFITK